MLPNNKSQMLLRVLKRGQNKDINTTANQIRLLEIIG